MSSSAVVSHLSVRSRPLKPKTGRTVRACQQDGAVALGVLFADDRRGDGQELVATALRRP